MDFSKLDFEKADALIPKETLEDVAAQAFLIDNNYWMEGEGYNGPRPDEDSGEDVMAYLESAFIGIPLYGEFTRRHVNGVLGQEPSFETVLEGFAAIKKDFDEAEGAHWDERDGHEMLQLLCGYLCATNKGFIRFDVPPAYLVPAETTDGQTVDAVVAKTTYREALDLIHFEALPKGAAVLHTDPETLKQLSVFRFTETTVDDKGDETKVKCVQVCYLETPSERASAKAEAIEDESIATGDDGPDEDVLTVVTIHKETKGVAPQTTRINTGGVLPIIEAKHHPLLFQPFVSKTNNQILKGMNSASTMVVVNGHLAGFPERIGIDIEPPTVDSDEIDPKTGEPKQIKVDVAVGALTNPMLASMTDEIVDDVTQTSKETPRSGQFIFRQPVSSEPLRKDIEFMMAILYRNVRQYHALNNVGADASGIALMEARSDFYLSLLQSATKIEGAMRKLQRGKRFMAIHFMGDAGSQYLEAAKAARDNVNCHPSSGQLSVAERNQVILEYEKGIKSEYSTLVALGTEDVEAEIKELRKDEARRNFGEYQPETAVNDTSGDDVAVQ